MANFDPADTGYIDVAARIAEFRGKYPDGSLQPADLTKPYTIEKIDNQTFIVVAAAAYRDPGDERPGIGMAYEQFPGKTPYTKGSELQNAETSAWGRAIVAALASDTKRGIASQEEVRNRQAERDHDELPRPKPVITADSNPGEIRTAIKAAGESKSLTIQEIAEDFHEWSKGEQIGASPSEVLFEYLQWLTRQSAA